ncbi:MAG: hypothetical protein ACR2MA_10810 [Egibacteraceae bacterium]
MVKQRVSFALDLVDRVVFMTRGEITACEDATTLCGDPDAVSRHLGFG